MSSNNTLMEAHAFAELRRFAEACEPFINFDRLNISESRVKLTPALAGALTQYDNYIFENEDAARLDREQFRAGIDPFNEWLNLSNSDLAAMYQNVSEGIWDGLKDVASAVGDGVKQAGSWAVGQIPGGQKIKDFIKALTEGGSGIGVLHLLLDIIGLIPASMLGFPIDIAADLLNATIYLSRGMYVNALISAIAILPWGDAFKSLKITFTQPLKALGHAIAQVFKKNDKGAREAAQALAKMKGSRELMKKLGPAITGMGNAVKKILGGITKFIAKFMPASIQAKMNTWFTVNVVNPMGHVESAIKLVEDYAGTKAFQKLSKADPALTGNVKVADRMKDAAGMAKRADIPVTMHNGSVRHMSAGTISASVENAIKKHKIKPDQLDIIVKAGDSEVVNLFSKIEADPKLMQKLSVTEQASVKLAQQNPKAFIAAYNRGKTLNKSIDSVLKLAKAGSKGRYATKIARLIIMVFLRNYMNGNDWKCIGAVRSIKNMYNKGKAVYDFTHKASNVLGESTDPLEQLQMQDDESLPVESMEGEAPAPEAGEKAVTKMSDDGCEEISVRMKDQVEIPNIIKELIPETPFGDTKPRTDSANQEMFETMVNPTLKDLGLEEVYKTIQSEYTARPAQERVNDVEVFDEVKFEFSVPTTEEEENQRFEEFIKRELKNGTHSAEELQRMVDSARQKNAAIDKKLNNNSNNAPLPESNGSFRIMSFKNFIK